MASYKVHLKRSAERDLRKLPTTVLARVHGKIEALAHQPFPAEAIKLAGAERFFRVRAGAYRIIYTVDVAARSVLVHYIRHRRDVYRSL